MKSLGGAATNSASTRPAPIALVIINYNTCDHLRNCLESMRAYQGEVIVVDSGSTDGSLELLRTQFPRVTVRLTEGNLGYGAAANLGIRVSQSEYVLLLNSDTLIRPETATALASFLDSHPRAGLAGPRLVNPDRTLQLSTFPNPTPLDIFLDTTNLTRVIRRIPGLDERYLRTWSHVQPRRVPWVSGAAMAIRRSAFDAVFGFDEAFFMYFEEVDLCYRLAEAGWETWFAPVTEIVHVGGASTRQRRAEMTVEFYRSLYRFYQQHYSSLQSAELVALVKLVALARLARDWIALRRNDRHEREGLAQNMTAWQRLVAGDWQVTAK